MALKDHFFIDTGRYYSYAQKYEKFTSQTVSVGSQSIGTFGPDGRFAHRASWPGISGPPFFNRFGKTIQPCNNTAISSFRYRRSALAGNTMTIAQIFSTGPFALVGLAMNQDSTFSFLLGEWGFLASTVLATSGATLAVGEFGHIEWRTTFGTSGTMDLWLNGDLILHYAGNLGTTQWTHGSWGMSAYNNIGTYNAVDNDFLDIILRDGTARIVREGELLLGTDPWGDTRVICLLSQSGNGFYTAWSPSTGANHGAMVDDTTQDDDATYIKSGTDGARDSFNMEDLPTDIGEVLAIQVVSVARKEIPGTAFLQGFVRIAGVDYDGDRSNGISTTYQHLLTPFTTHDGTPFTVAEINACQSGPIQLHATVGEATTPCGGSGVGDDPGPGDTDCAECDGVPDPGLPTWFYDLLVAAGATDCFNPNIIEAIESDLNAAGYAPQRSSGCDIRPRLYFGTLDSSFCGKPMVSNFDNYVNITASDGCSWDWLPNF